MGLCWEFPVGRAVPVERGKAEMSGNPCGAGDFDGFDFDGSDFDGSIFDGSGFADPDAEEALMWLRGYCELASDTLEGLRSSMLELKGQIEEIKRLGDSGV